jgi:hypothetical protein
VIAGAAVILLIQWSPGTRAAQARCVPIQPFMEASMVEKELTVQHIDIAETFVRLYEFMTQYIDSCESDTVRKDILTQNFRRIWPPPGRRYWIF